MASGQTDQVVLGLVGTDCHPTQIGLQVINMQERLSERLEVVVQDVAHLERQRVLFSSSPAMQRALGRFYGDIVELCVAAAVFVRKHVTGWFTA